ncbi:cell division protein FtsZ [Prevotella sp.]|uniref:cell division protein FtsZ n=1 Tax=uncultured Prevotella sp. TaxID=159272 RepID=UPI0025D79BD2|nr:cell division protein FtsZ [Prevotella sp.]
MADDKKIGRMASAFGEPDKPSSIIKVIGVGGGGGNAVNHMYREGIHNVTFVLCNTDKKALDDSPVPVHLQLGKEGLGAGNKPEKGQQEAEDSEPEIRNMLDDGTKMVFITAGMGGGTGTGAGPVVARIAKDMGILTVGIVTIPFKWEGKKKILQALAGVERMAKNVDALLVINNERLFSIYGQLSVEDAFGKADDTLSIAAKSIAEIITMHGIINLDFNDVKTVLKDGGVALMSTGYGEGEDRMKKAIDNALHSPLLNDNDVYNSKKILLSVSFAGGENGQSTLMMEEMSAVTEFMDGFDDDIETKWGLSRDPELGEKIKVTILATGFGVKVEDGEMNITDQKAMSAAEIRNKRAQEAAEQNLIQNYYGKTGTGNERLRPRFFLFSNEDLDNDNLISAVEATPTYKRSKLQYDELVRQSKGDIELNAPATTKAAPVSGTIKFG